MATAAIALPMEEIAEFCDRWQVTEFPLFGSVLRDDFRPDNDIDVLLTFAPTAKRNLIETLQMRDELQAICSDKFIVYRTIPGFQEYLLIDQYCVHVEHHVKTAVNQWLFSAYDDPAVTLSLSTLGLQVQIADLYEDIDF